MKNARYDSRVDAAIAKAADGARYAADKTVHATQQAKHGIQDAGHQLIETEKKWARASNKYAHRNPWLIAGVAFAAGYVIRSFVRHSNSEYENED